MVKNDCPPGTYCTPKENRVIKYLERVLNVLIFLLIVSLIILILRELYVLFVYELFKNGNVKEIVDLILFVFILIELFTVLISYLKKGYIKVERIIEVGIISIVRDLIFHIETALPQKLYSSAAILLVFGAIFFIEKRFSRQRNV